MRFINNSIIFIMLVSFSGCATMMNSPQQKVKIASTPALADIWVDDQYVGQTPKVVSLPRSKSHKVRIQKNGYKAYEAHLQRKSSKWILGNILMPGGLVGAGVDHVNGSAYVLSPDHMDAKLQIN